MSSVKPKHLISPRADGDTHNQTNGFRKTLSQILNLFLYERNDTNIKKALSLVLSFINADRISLRVFASDEDLVEFDYNVVKEGIPAYLFTIHDYIEAKEFGEEKINWIKQSILNGKEIIIDDLSSLPAEYELFRDLFEKNQILSALILPIFCKDRVIGYIAIDFVDQTYKWEQIDIDNLKIISDIFSNTIDHERINRAMEVSALNSLKNEVLLKIVFQKLPFGVELYDEKGALTRVNPADLEILGTTREAVLGVNLFDNPTIPDDIKEKIKKGEEVRFGNHYSFEDIQSKGYYESKFSNIRKSLFGNCLPLKDAQKNIFGYLMLIHDNTEDFKQKKELEYNLTKLRMALDTGNALIWEYDVEANKLSFDETLNGDIGTSVFAQSDHFNKSTATDQLEGLHPDDAERFYTQAMTPILNGEIPQITISYRQYINGKLEWLTSNFRSFIPEGHKKPVKVFCYTMVTTEQHELERKLVEIKETDRLKTLFMKNLSHEIRTPLNAIIGFSNVIAELNKTEQNEELVDLINENNDILLHLFDNMLDLSKIETGEMDYMYNMVDIKNICTDLYVYYSTQTQPTVSLQFDFLSPIIELYCDKKRVLQVISLLLDNAIKFTENGKICLSYHHLENSNQLKIAVSDTGVGLLEQEIKYLFNPFYKADTFTKGTGLGLHIAHQIVRDMGGEIGVESKKGIGSTFWFTLPLSTNDPMA